MTVIQRLKIFEILVHNFIVCFVEIFSAYLHTTVKRHARLDTFFRNHEPNRVPEIGLSFSNELHPFLAQYFMHHFSHHFPSKVRLGHDRNVIKLFSPLNLTIICINPFFTSNNTTFSVSFLNEISFLHKTSFFKYAITDSIKNLIFSLSNAPSLKSLW